MGLSWAPLGLSWGLPGTLWDPSGSNFGVQNPLQERIASWFFTKIVQEASQEGPGSLPGGSQEPLGSLVGTILGPSWEDFGKNLGIIRELLGHAFAPVIRATTSRFFSTNHIPR